MTGLTLSAGDSLPDFTLALPGGGTVSRDDLAGAPAVLYFYPRDDTPGCTTEAKDFSALMPEFTAMGVRVIGVSKDSAEKHARFAAKHGLAVDLATDAESGGLSDAIGVWGEKQLYGKRFMGMVRATLLVDSEGRVARAWPKVKVAGHADEVLAAARAL